ncbi:5853_t:CDS:2 [Funneliformis geosporum]|nr:5853_t:CDS:2 [Funneliformis geosporum]
MLWIKDAIKFYKIGLVLIIIDSANDQETLGPFLKTQADYWTLSDVNIHSK